MDNIFGFLKEFPKNQEGLYIVYELFTFDNLFKLIMSQGFTNKETLYFMLANCSFSSVVFQERIHNKKYNLLNTKNVLSPEEASVKAKLIYDLLEIYNKNT